MTPEPAQPAETWLNDPVSLESGEPAQPAESPEARALCPKAVAAAIKATEYKYFGDYEMSDDQREAVDVLVEVARRHFAATTARPTERGAVEALQLARPIVEADLEAAKEQGDADWEGMSFTALEAIDDALTPPVTVAATDQAGEVERRERLIEQLEAEFGDSYDCTRVWSAWGVGTMGEDDFVPVSDRVGEIADGILAALDTQPATGRTMGEKEKLRAALQEIVDNDDEQATLSDLMQHDRNAGYLTGVRDCANIARAALQNGGE